MTDLAPYVLPPAVRDFCLASAQGIVDDPLHVPAEDIVTACRIVEVNDPKNAVRARLLRQAVEGGASFAGGL